MPSKLEDIPEPLDPMEVPIDPPILLLPETTLLDPFPPTKLKARLPLPAPSNRAAAERTPPPELGVVGVDGC